MNEFQLHRPTSIDEAVRLLGTSEDARLLSGGQSLLPTMKLGLTAPVDVIDLSAIGALRGISIEGDSVRIGAMARHAEVAASPQVRAAIPALAALADGIGDVAVRNRGTLGGSLANNDPAACYPAAVLGLAATLHTDRRSVAADDFFVDVFQTALEADEIVTAVSFPVPRKAAYVKFAQPASHYAMVGVFVALTADGPRVAVTGAGPCVFRAEPLERALAADWSAGACRAVTIPADGLNADLHASAAYRAHLIGVLAARAVTRAG